MGIIKIIVNIIKKILKFLGIIFCSMGVFFYTLLFFMWDSISEGETPVPSFLFLFMDLLFIFFLYLLIRKKKPKSSELKHTDDVPAPIAPIIPPSVEPSHEVIASTQTLEPVNDIKTENSIHKVDDKPINRREILENTSAAYTQDDFRILTDCIDIVKKTDNLETFFSRFHLGEEKSHILGVYENKNVLQSFLDIAIPMKLRVLQDSFQKESKNISMLKTTKGQQNRWIKYLNQLEEYKNEYSSDYLEEYKNIVQTVRSKIEDDSTNSVNNISTNEFNSEHTFSTLTIPNYTQNIHEDLQGLLWIGDGPNQNYYPDKTPEINENNLYFKIHTKFAVEPSTIYTNLPISQPDDISNINRPPYYPTYSSLTPEQRWIYLDFLCNPYSTYDIGYVFILYYGLERHMLYGNFEQAFDIILKLRDTYNNSSFQVYSSTAVVLMCIFHNRRDLLNKFIDSLDKEYEQKLDFEIFILTCLFSGTGISSDQLIRYSRVFGFTNMRYIKSDYKLFASMLIDTLNETYQQSYLPVDYLKNHSTPTYELPVFANMSISQKTIKLPKFSASEQLCQSGFNALQISHEKVKKYKAEQRKKKINK